MAKKAYAQPAPVLATEKQLKISPRATASAHGPYDETAIPRPLSLTVPLSNGSKQVTCQLNAMPELNLDATSPQQAWQYRMSLAYKSISFSTAPFSRLDMAYDALQQKLAAKGLHIQSCGSCGYFYAPNPTIAGDGFCLFAKKGQNLDPVADQVTVVSPDCNAYTEVQQRPRLLHQWQQTMPQPELPFRALGVSQ